MRNNEIKLKYLPIFEKDLKDAVIYIKETLNSPSAARDLADKTEMAILERTKYPTSFGTLSLYHGKRRDLLLYTR